MERMYARARESFLYSFVSIVLLALGLTFGLAGCGGGQQAQQPEEEQQVEQPQEQPQAEEQPAEEQEAEEDLVEQGRQLAQSQGCMGCHTADGSQSVGPTWKGLYGSTEELEDGSTVTVDEEYLRESIVDPNAKIVKGFPPSMPAYGQLSDEQIQALIAYIKSLSE